MLAESVGTTNDRIAAPVAQVSLLRPDLIPDLEPVFKLADSLSPDRAGLPSSRNLAKGIVAYRRGAFVEALKCFDGWQWYAELNYGPASFAGYFCAMIHFKQGDFRAAQTDLREAATRLEALVHSGELGYNWVWYGKATVIRAEAEQMILGREVSTTVNAAWLKEARARWAPVRQRLNEGDRLVFQKRWTAARDAYWAAIHQPAFDWEAAEAAWPIGNSIMATKIGVTFLLAGDTTNYAQLCKMLLTRLDAHPDPFIWHTLRTCLAGQLPQGSELLKKLDQRATQLTQNPKGAAPEIVNLIRTMAAYRSGRYKEASGAAITGGRLSVRNATQIVRAMALARSGRAEEGKRDLQQAETNLVQPLKLLTGDLWWDLAMCQLLLDEAHRVLSETPLKR
jgi:hypothetical protein